GEKQPPALRGIALEGEIAREQSHHQRSGDVLDQRRIGKCGAEPACGYEIDPVTQRGAEPAAEEDDQKPHRQKTMRGVRGGQCKLAKTAARLPKLWADLANCMQAHSGGFWQIPFPICRL